MEAGLGTFKEKDDQLQCKVEMKAYLLKFVPPLATFKMAAPTLHQ
jgi:hypothetical protein